MKVLIVGKTEMTNGVCVGALTLDRCEALRLFESDGSYPTRDTEYEVGEIWNIKCRKKQNLQPPHLESVIVEEAEFVQEHPDTTGFLRANVQPWRGAPEALFGGLVQFRQKSGTGYICQETGVPDASTGFWVSDRDLTMSSDEEKVSYHYQYGALHRRLTYKGCEEAIGVIGAGNIIRVSLSQWWTPPGESEKRCWLQLSGWFGAI